MEIRKRPYQFNFSGNSIFYELYDASPEQFSFQVSIMFKREDEDEFTSITSQPLTFTPVNGTALINIADYIDSRLEYDIPPVKEKRDGLVIDLTPDYFIGKRQCGQFYILYRFVTADNEGPWVNSEQNFSCRVLKGGVNKYHFSGNNFWINYLPEQKPYLSWLPDQRLVAADEMIFLAWYQAQLYPGNLQAKILVQYTDGDYTEKIFDLKSEFGRVLYFPAGAAQLELEDLSEKKIWYWEIRLGAQHSQFEPLARTLRFYMDNRKDYSGVTLHYRNSLGGFDNVRVRSEIEEAAEYTLSEAQHIIGPYYFGDQVLPGENTIHDSAEQITYKGSIIQLQKEEADRMRDMFVKREVYWWKKRRWWPVKVTIKSLTARNTADKRWGLPIEWQIAADPSRYYTPESVDMGIGNLRSNTCFGSIMRIDTVKTFEADVCVVRHTFILNPLQSSNVILVRWWIPGVVEQKQDHYVVNGNTIAVSHPVNQPFVINMQPVCKNNLDGATKSKSYDTTEPETPPIVIDPTPIDPGTQHPLHRIINETNIATPFRLSSAGNVIIAGDLPAGGSLPLPMAMVGVRYSSMHVSTDAFDIKKATLKTLTQFKSGFNVTLVGTGKPSITFTATTIDQYCEIRIS